MQDSTNTRQVMPGGLLDHYALSRAPLGTGQSGLLIFPSEIQESPLSAHELCDPNVGNAVVESNNLQGAYFLNGEDEMQYDDIWSQLDSDTLVQRSTQYSVPPGDLQMLESYGYDSDASCIRAPEAMRDTMTSGSEQGATAPVGVVQTAVNHKTWTLHSHAIPDEAESSSREEVGYTSSKCIGRTLGRLPVGSSFSQAEDDQPHHVEVAQDFRQNHRQDITSFADVEFEFSLMEPRLEFMDTIMEDTLSDKDSSTHPDRHEGVCFAYSSSTATPVSEEASGLYGVADGSSSPEGNFREQIHRSLERPTQEVAHGPAESIHDETMKNDVTILMSPGQSGIRHLGEPRWAEQLLNLCAAAIASRNFSRTQHLMWVLNDLASTQGDANQRLAAYGLRALFCRITGKLEAAASCSRPRHHDQEASLGPKLVHRALIKFHEYSPWHQICYTVTSQTLLELCAGKRHLHVIDIGVGEGIEWPIFIDALVSRAGGPPALLRITMMRDNRKEDLNLKTDLPLDASGFMTRLVKFARLLGLHIELRLVQKSLECATREDLKLREGEMLAVVCHFRLHRLSNEIGGLSARPVSTPTSRPLLSPRDEFLDFLLKLEPHVLIMSDNDVDHLSPDFLTRFQNIISFWWKCFESMEAGYNGRDPDDRQIIDYEAGVVMLNQVACEGYMRIERNDSQQGWSRRIKRAGFLPMDISEETRKAAQNLVRSHGELWDVAFSDTNVVSLLWKNQPTTFTSIWRPPSCSKILCKCNLLHK